MYGSENAETTKTVVIIEIKKLVQMIGPYKCSLHNSDIVTFLKNDRNREAK